MMTMMIQYCALQYIVPKDPNFGRYMYRDYIPNEFVPHLMVPTQPVNTGTVNLN